MKPLLIAWTTTPDASTASELARGLIEADLVVCAQVSGPIQSHYKWQGKYECSEEYRLTLKFLQSKCDAVEKWILKHHPYEVPQWIGIEAGFGSDAYLAWTSESLE